MRSIEFIDQVRREHCTLLGVGPMSTNCIDATIELSQNTRFPLMLIASRRQIDAEVFGGGYVNNWSTENLADYISTKGIDESVWLCRDHGGPWQNSLDIENNVDLSVAMRNAKRSFEVDIDAGFKVIHIDPSIDPFSKISTEVALDRIFELYEFCWDIAQKNDREIYFEIGTEEQSGSTNTKEELDYTLSRVNAFCKNQNIPAPTFVVVQTGTKVMETQNVGSFSSSLRVPGELSPEVQIPQMVEICETHNILIKQHNTDYLADQDLVWLPHLSIHAANVAPEFGVEETKAQLNLMSEFELTKLKEKFLEAAYKSLKWKKWMLMDTTASDEQRAIIAGHYIFASEEYQDIRLELAHEASRRSVDSDQVIYEAVRASIYRYVANFNLERKRR